MALDEATNPMQGVSGPGKFAKRTDLEYQSQAYGDGVQYAADKAGAPLAKAQKSPMLSEAPTVRATQEAAGLYDKTARPDEPITAGVDIGAGPGSNALMMQSRFAQVKLSDTLAQMLPYDTTGEIGILYERAVARGM
jgi:hypothetical protein